MRLEPPYNNLEKKRYRNSRKRSEEGLPRILQHDKKKDCKYEYVPSDHFTESVD